MSNPVVMHVIDTLAPGGAERVAVNIANELAMRGFESHLCSTRGSGLLEADVDERVHRLPLMRRNRVDRLWVAELRQYVRDRNVDIIHTHSTSLFFVALAYPTPKRPVFVWHDHRGDAGMEPSSPYWLGRPWIDVAVSVTDAMYDWHERRLRIPRPRLSRLPNFALPTPRPLEVPLPGSPGYRVACVANIRPPKDQITLVRAFAVVAEREPKAQLLLVGACGDASYGAKVKAEIARLRLGKQVTMLGARHDIGAILAGCTIGVLSSRQEGFPLALVEYGIAQLAVVATTVGQIPEILDHGGAGELVPPEQPPQLAASILDLLGSPSRQEDLGQRLHNHVERRFGADRAFDQLVEIYRVAQEVRRRISVRPSSSLR